MMGPHAAGIAGKLYHDLRAKDQNSIQTVPAVTVIANPGK
jgi:hypothetical protein